MKIEVGKYYRTRDGRKAWIYAVDGGGKEMETFWMIWNEKGTAPRVKHTCIFREGRDD